MLSATTSLVSVNNLLVCIVIIGKISTSFGQYCDFQWPASNRGSGSGPSFGSSGSRYKLPSEDKEKCPCFHGDNSESSDKEDCPSPVPFSPLIDCDYLPREFIECSEPVDHAGNATARDQLGHGCLKFGGQRWEDV